MNKNMTSTEYFLHYLTNLCVSNNLSKLNTLLNNYPEYINKTEDAKITALMIACRDGSVEQVKLLLDRGSEINAKDRNGLNALHYVCLSKTKRKLSERIKIIDLLIKNNMNVNCLDNLGNSPLYYAVGNTQNPYIISKQLIKNGANIKEINNNDETILIKNGANIKEINNNDETILINHMIYNGDALSLSLIKMLLKGGVDVNKRLPLYNVDALEIAIDKKVVKITKELLEYKFKLYNKINDQKDIKKIKSILCKLQNRNNMNINAGYGQQNGYLIKQLLNNKQAELLHEEINNHIIHDKDSSTTRFKQNRKF